MSDCNHDVKQKMCQMGKCKPTPGALTREQVEDHCNMLADANVDWPGRESLSEALLDHGAALRATITQQAQELERLEGVCKERLEQGQQLHDQLRQLYDQLAASQARCREMEREIETLTTCSCEGCDDNLEESAFCFPCMNKVQQQVTQLQATLAAREARIDELEGWQKIVIGSGTDQETVIRMAANEYTKTAVQCWKDHTKKIEAERDAAVQKVTRVREAAGNLTCEVCKMDMQRALKARGSSGGAANHEGVGA